MKIKAHFIKSAVLPEDYPEASRSEIAMVGRSNAGKSSLLNSMTGGIKIAKISNTPGKTRLLNFFDVGDHYRLVDLPGYGFAARDRTEREMWANMIEKYIDVRLSLIGIILVCDVRRTWTEEEQRIVDMAGVKNLRSICVLTKADKLNQKDLNQQIKKWQSTSGFGHEYFRPVSSLKDMGVREFEKFLFNNWIKA